MEDRLVEPERTARLLSEAVARGETAFRADPSDPAVVDAYASSLEELGAFYFARGDQDLSRTVLYLFSAAAGLACSVIGRGHRDGRPRRPRGGIRLEPASHLSTRGLALDPAWRDPAALCDGECFDLERSALSISGGAAVESAPVAQFSAVLCTAATYTASSGAGAGHSAHPQAGPHSGADPVGVVGASGSVACYFH